MRRVGRIEWLVGLSAILGCAPSDDVAAQEQRAQAPDVSCGETVAWSVKLHENLIFSRLQGEQSRMLAVKER